MLAEVLFICLALVSPLVCSSAVQKDDRVRNQYFSHVKDRRSALSPRIVGGEEVTPYSYPFQVLLLVYKELTVYFCGGSLISNQWVLTAAQCVIMEPKYILVGLGYHDLRFIPSTVVVMNATRYVAHEGYDPDSYQNDIALVRLPRNATFTDHIQPVDLVDGTDTYEGANATVLGWGQTETEFPSQVLRAANSTILSNAVCANTSWDYENVIKSTHLCISGVGAVGICSGDGGGPLLVDGVQVGITSFGTTDCELAMPSVFTRITEFRSWISENVRDDDTDDDDNGNDDGDDDDDDDGDDDDGNGANGLDGLRLAAVVLIALCFSYLIK